MLCVIALQDPGGEVIFKKKKKEKEFEYVWVCKRCLRVTREPGSVHAKEPDKPDWCKGEFIKKPGLVRSLLRLHPVVSFQGKKRDL